MLLAVQAQSSSKMTVLAQHDVMHRLQQHRLHELVSTGEKPEL